VITEYAVCALPQDHAGWRHYALRVQRRAATDNWVVAWVGEYLWLNGGEPEWVMNPGNASQFTEESALSVAEQLAPEIVVNDITVRQALERSWR
jgi:hypothetical protein